MERVSLFVDMYNFVSNSAEYLNQKSFIDFSKFHQYFISDKQIFGKTYLYGGTSFGKMLDKLEKETNIDNINGELLGIVVQKSIDKYAEGIGFATRLEEIKKFLE